MRILIASTVFSLATLAGSGVQAQPLGLTAPMPETVKFVDARLDEAMTTIARIAGVTIDFDASVSEADRGRLVGHVTLVKTSAADALTFLAKHAGLTYTAVDAKTVRIARR
jgi:hypothetical protein